MLCDVGLMAVLKICSRRHVVIKHLVKFDHNRGIVSCCEALEGHIMTAVNSERDKYRDNERLQPLGSWDLF